MSRTPHLNPLPLLQGERRRKNARYFFVGALCIKCLVMQNTIFLDLSGRVKLSITGADRLRFLNGQITNDLRKASETSAIEACILNAKGKTDAQIYVSV